MTNFKVELLLPEDIAVVCLNAIKSQVLHSCNQNLYEADPAAENTSVDVEKMIAYLTVIKQVEDLTSQIESAILKNEQELSDLSKQNHKDDLQEVVDAF